MLEVALKHDFQGFGLDAAFAAPNGVTVLFGRSGSGKSTIVKAVAGLLRPDSGRITLGGDVLLDTARGIALPPHRRRIGRRQRKQMGSKRKIPTVFTTRYEWMVPGEYQRVIIVFLDEFRQFRKQVGLIHVQGCWCPVTQNGGSGLITPGYQGGYAACRQDTRQYPTGLLQCFSS